MSLFDLQDASRTPQEKQSAADQLADARMRNPDDPMFDRHYAAARDAGYSQAEIRAGVHKRPTFPPDW